MYQSRTQIRIDDFVMWSSLAVYATIWMVGLGYGSGGEWLLAGWTTMTYVGMHFFEITRRGHCYLSADSTAFPVSLVCFSLAVFGMWTFGYPPMPNKSLDRVWGMYAVVFTGGHIAALVYAKVLTTTLSFLFRKRIAAEKAGHPEPDPKPSSSCR